MNAAVKKIRVMAPSLQILALTGRLETPAKATGGITTNHLEKARSSSDHYAEVLIQRNITEFPRGTYTTQQWPALRGEAMEPRAGGSDRPSA